jgi:RNA polymerase sigma-70 factor, ECF subfamily
VGSTLASVICEHEAWLYERVLGMVRQADLAADITQEAICRALSSRPDASDPQAFRGWLAAVAKNLWMDHGRRRRRLAPGDPEDEFGAYVTGFTAGTPEDSLILGETRAQVRRALSQLGATHRVPLMMRQYGGMAYEDIALALDVAPATARSRVHRALRKLGPLLATITQEVAIPMDCTEARSRLPGYVLAGSDLPSDRELGAHLTGCTACTEEHGVLQEAVGRGSHASTLPTQDHILYVNGDGSCVSHIRSSRATPISHFDCNKASEVLWVRDADGSAIPFAREEGSEGHWRYNLGSRGSEGYWDVLACISHDDGAHIGPDGSEEISHAQRPGPVLYRFTVKLAGALRELSATPAAEEHREARFAILAWRKQLTDEDTTFECRVTFRRDT